MKNVHFILNYFVSPEKRNKPNITLSDKSGIKLSWGMQKSYANCITYTNWLTSLIKYSKELDIEIVKLAKLIREGYVKNLGWYDEDLFINIFLDSIDPNNNGKIEENILSYNAKVLDNE